MFEIIYILLYIINTIQTSTNFPNGFEFGAATASYQIEGGWNKNGKGENIWDKFTHNYPKLITDHSTGDIACNSYNLWQEDIKNLKYLGVDFYRFSLSWTRLLPNGFTNHINKDGVIYYDKLINQLLLHNIKPIITIYHWDLPQTLQDLGGWTNPLIAEYLCDFAKLVFNLYGDRVKTWITINEPYSICEDTYGNGEGALNFTSAGIGDYLCGKTVLLAHAYIYRMYDMEFREKQGGKIGITLDSIWAEPMTNNTRDQVAAEREIQMSMGWWAHPIYSTTGDYPEIMKKRINEMSKKENFTTTRLPLLTKNEIKLIHGTWDFFGLNHYHTWLIEDYEYPNNYPTSFEKDKGTKSKQDPNWKPSPRIVPWGLRKLLNWIKNEYNNPLILITENGIGDDGVIDDQERVLFLKEYLKALLQAINEDGCNVKGYTVWSLMDNMEWRSGYTIKFGLYHVDFNNTQRTRTAKTSVKFYKYVATTKSLPEK